jgi:signal transduction histidine kinase
VNQADSLARFSHEFRTPLHAILAFTQLLQADAELPAHAQDKLSHVHTAAQHLLSLVTDFLDLARIEQGLQTLRVLPVPALEALASASALVAPLAQQRGVVLLPVVGGEGLQLQADPRALTQVLLNLLSNAIKYNRPHGRLWLEICQVGTHGVLCVSDEGPGLSQAQRLRLFTPFDRLGAEHSSTPGSGLGLVICQQLTQAMHGHLQVHDRLEGGCRFELWLPSVTDPAQEASDTTPASLPV